MPSLTVDQYADWIRPPLVERTVRIGGNDLNVAVAGQGAPIVMFHGATRCWQTFAAMIPALALNYRVIAPDHRGHAKSGREVGGYLVADYLKDACEMIERETSGPVRVYGHSLGAMVAAGVAAKLPDRVVGAILEDPPFHTMGDRIGEGPLLSQFRCYAELAGSQKPVEAIAAKLAACELVNPADGSRKRFGDTRDAVSLRFTARCLKQLDPRVMTPIVGARWLDGYDPDEIFRHIKCPTLLLQADAAAGGMLTTEDAERFCSFGPQFTLLKFPGVSHMIHGTQTQQVLNLALNFFGSIE